MRVQEIARSTFNLQTMILAPEGERISGGQLMEPIAEAKRYGVTAASLAAKLPNVNVETFVMLAAGVVGQVPRRPREKRS